MKTNAIISALCVVGITWFGAGCDKALTTRSNNGLMLGADARPGTIPIQQVVYWSDIPGMKWNWSTQVTNKPVIPTVPTDVSTFNNDANYVSAINATNIAKAIIRDKVKNLNTNLQSAEDTRATLTNLITILKNL